MWGFTDGQSLLPIHVLEQKRVRLRLQTVRPTTRAWIEFIGCKVAHDFPIAIRVEQVTEASIAYVADVKRFVLFIEEESARGDEPIA